MDKQIQYLPFGISSGYEEDGEFFVQWTTPDGDVFHDLESTTLN